MKGVAQFWAKPGHVMVAIHIITVQRSTISQYQKKSLIQKPQASFQGYLV
jgi:hypothetical protein